MTANPTAIPAMANKSGTPAAMAEPNAMNKRIKVGRPESNSALCKAFSFSWLKSSHMAHSPVVLAFTPSGKVWPSSHFMTLPAEMGKSASSVACNITGMMMVLPSCEMRPDSIGSSKGFIAPALPGAVAAPAAKVATVSGESVTDTSCCTTIIAASAPT